MSDAPLPVCTPDAPPVGCCLVAIPNTSEWAVVCASPTSNVATVPALTEAGALLFGVLLIAAAMRSLR